MNAQHETQPAQEQQAEQASTTPPTTAEEQAAAVATNPSRRRLSSGDAPGTTSRGSKRKARASPVSTRISAGARIKVTKQNILHVLVSAEQRTCLEGQPSNRNYFGTALGGSGRGLYRIKLDAFPHGHQEVPRVRRTHLTVLQPQADEPEVDRAVMELSEVRPSPRRLSPPEASQAEFANLDKQTLEDATSFRLKYGSGDHEFIEWDILKDTEHIEEDPLLLPNVVTYEKDIPWSDDCDYNELFFEHFFPSIVGHGQVIDEYLGDPRCPYYLTFMGRQQERFHDPTNETDPDWKVRLCYTLLIAAASELHRGIDNLWKSGKSGSRHDYPDFGQWISKPQFKMFVHAAPLCWCDRELWYVDRNERPWEVFLPVLSKFNGRRRELFKTVLLMLDESMSGWRPKTSKLGGLPNYTFEPRKPVPLGTMFRNGVECITGCLVFQDVVQMPELQASKKFMNELTFLPGSPHMQTHTAEVLRQVEGAGVIEGGWVGGDAWFGSIMTAVEVFRRLQVHSTWIIKGNTTFFPMKALHAVLVARFGDRPAGHWVVMKTTIADVPLFAMAYAWSQKGVSYFVSTCGKTTPHPMKYRTHFEDEWGNVNYKEIDRPWIAHFLYDYLPLIDEHNKQRQRYLRLEKRWPTKDCWFRLLTTLLGMCVVDMHRWKRNMMSSAASLSPPPADDDDDDDQIIPFSDQICVWLNKMRRANRQQPRRSSGSTIGPASLVRIAKGPNGETTREVTDKQRIGEGRVKGAAHQLNCWVCRKYLKANGAVNYVLTPWICNKCGMALCQKSRAGEPPARELSCFEEHMNSDDPVLQCIRVERSVVFPRDAAVNLWIED